MSYSYCALYPWKVDAEIHASDVAVLKEIHSRLHKKYHLCSTAQKGLAAAVKISTRHLRRCLTILREKGYIAQHYRAKSMVVYWSVSLWGKIEKGRRQLLEMRSQARQTKILGGVGHGCPTSYINEVKAASPEGESPPLDEKKRLNILINRYIEVRNADDEDFSWLFWENMPIKDSIKVVEMALATGKRIDEV